MAYDSIAECASFDSAAGANLHVVLYNHCANLRHLVMHTLMGGITEPVITNYRVGIYNHTIAYFASIVNGHIRIYYAVIAELYTLSNAHAWINYAAIPNFCIIGHSNEIMNVAVCTDFCAVRNYCPRADSYLFVLPIAMKQHHNLHKSVIWVLSYQKRNRNIRCFFAYDYGAGLGRLNLLFVFGVGQKTDVSFACSPERGGGVDYYAGVADNPAAYVFG